MSRRRDGGDRRSARDVAQQAAWEDQERARIQAEKEAERDRIAAILKYEPHNIEAEAAFLGALMIDNRLVESMSGKVKPEHFYEPFHGRAYERILSIVARGKLANPITLRPYFAGETWIVEDEHGRKVEQELSVYLAQCTGSGAALIGASDFAQQIVELAAMRDIIVVARETAEKAANAENLPAEIMRDAEARLLEISEAANIHAGAKAIGIDDAWDEAISEIEEAANGKPLAGFEIAQYVDWNEVVGRMEEGDLIYLGGRPSMGKTGVACAVAVGAAAAGEPTEFLSLEMNRRRIMRRVIANMIYEQGVTSGYTALNKGQLTTADWRAISAARDQIATFPFKVTAPDDEMVVEEIPGWIRRRKRAWASQGKTLKLVVVDYLGRLGTAKPFRTETEQVSYISRKLKQAAKETGVAMVVLVQLSRGVEQREDKRPMLSDLRQSGSLEQDADVVVFVYRDEYYLQRTKPKESDQKKFSAWEDDMIASRDRLELYSTKRREGDLTKRTGYFFSAYQAVRSSTYYRDDLYSRGGSQSAFENL